MGNLRTGEQTMIDYNLSMTVEQVVDLLRALDREIERNKGIISELPEDDREIRNECLKSIDRMELLKHKFEQDYERRNP